MRGADGCGCSDTFWTNPQYRVTVIDADDGDADNTGTLIVALLQKERRLKRTEGCDLLTIGYAIYKVRHASLGRNGSCLFSYVIIIIIIINNIIYLSQQSTQSETVKLNTMEQDSKAGCDLTAALYEFYKATEHEL